MFELLKSAYDLAEKGQLVDIGGFSWSSPSGLLGRRDFRGVMYLSPEGLEGVPIPRECLAAIMLTEDELEVGRSCGFTSVMARLGKEHRYYPCPPWTDRSRSIVYSMKNVNETSVLARTRRHGVRGACVRLVNENDLSLRLLPKAADRLREIASSTDSDDGILLMTEFDPVANWCPVWEPGQTRNQAIARPDSDGSTRTDDFIIFVPNRAENSETSFGYLEDGFAVLLTRSSWNIVRQALKSGAATAVALSAKRSVFSI